MNSKRKGSAGERELLEILLRNGIEAHRNEQRYIGGRNNPDISARFRGWGLHIEVKRKERLCLSEAINQARSDAGEGSFPVVIHRSNRQPWIVSFVLDDFLREVSNESQ